MKNIFSTHTIYIPRYDEKKQGDFASRAWNSLGNDRIRDDLWLYYRQCHETIINTPYPSFFERKRFNYLRAQTPNNCLSYAAGLVIKGDSSFNPCFFQYVDFHNRQQQQQSITMERKRNDTLKSVETPLQFKKDLAAGGIVLLNNKNKENFSHLSPIIGFIVKPNDYHFIKVDIVHTPSGPQTFFRQKQGYRKPILPRANLDDFSNNIQRISHHIHGACAFGAPLHLHDRKVHITLDDKTKDLSIFVKEAASLPPQRNVIMQSCGI